MSDSLRQALETVVAFASVHALEMASVTDDSPDDIWTGTSELLHIGLDMHLAAYRPVYDDMLNQHRKAKFQREVRTTIENL